jgi:choline dehydrogenase-like flavoprotein
MLFRSVEESVRSAFRPRVCIVGTGPAGISLALRLQQRGVTCLLVEAGGYDYSAASQEFYRGEVIGDPYHELRQARLRQFGGTSGHWSGWVHSLQASDFERHEHIPYSGWPISRTDLEPFAAAADDILEVLPDRGHRPMTQDINYIHYRYSPPVRFGAKYRAFVEQSSTIGLLLNTPVLELVPGENRIDSIKVSERQRGISDIRVDQVCVCTGGIENSRLLLWSNARHGGRVVKHADALGRYWMEHPVDDIADVVTFDNYEMQFEGHASERWLFAPSDRAKQTYAIGGAHIWMREHAENPSYLKELVQKVFCAAPDWSNRLLKHVGKEYHCGGLVKSEFEQAPRPENRVELDSRTDALHMPRPRLYWKKGEFERKSALTHAILLGQALIEQNIGRLRIRNFLADNMPWPGSAQPGGWHHMGGTRMAASPATGVVDKDCKVFGMDNLYIGGSSVFTTGGHASPTYSIVQLALRLGDHLATKLARG